MNFQITKALNKTSQKGAALIEFALVFTLLWAVFWSMACYVVPLLILQSMHRATAEGAQVGAMTTSNVLRISQAKEAALQGMNWVPAMWRVSMSAEGTEAKTNAECPLDENGHLTACVLVVKLTMNYADNAPLKPIINLPKIGTIPKLPTTLSSTSEVLLL
jgi:Flp pilus assembly protein TadG